VVIVIVVVTMTNTNPIFMAVVCIQIDRCGTPPQAGRTTVGAVDLLESGLCLRSVNGAGHEQGLTGGFGTAGADGGIFPPSLNDGGCVNRGQ